MRKREQEFIRIRGAREHNLQDVDVDIPLGALTVVTGPSGSGKTSLAMNTLYAEGQRRYVETFSPYVRQFMDRMDKPDVDAIENVLPAIALHQRNSVRTSRSTVGTMTGLNEYWKFIFARLAVGHDPVTGREVSPKTPLSICRVALEMWGEGQDVLIAFGVKQPDGVDDELMRADLVAQGYMRLFAQGRPERLDDEGALSLKSGVSALDEDGKVLVIQDRVKLDVSERGRMMEAVEAGLNLGGSAIFLIPRDGDGNGDGNGWGAPIEFRGDWFPLMEPTPGLFSSNSPLGACPECRGYGRMITIDYSRAIVPTLSLKEGALSIYETGRGTECKEDLMRAIERRGDIRADVPWQDLSKKERDWVMEGDTPDWEAAWSSGQLWYGVKGFFKAMERQSHKMLVRVWLSKFRVYKVCPSCEGKRLRSEAMMFTIGGKTLPDLQAMPMDELLVWVNEFIVPHRGEDSSLKHAIAELHSRIAYLNKVGLGYIASSRATRSLSGGEIERVSLTTCLGASLTDTLFVLDEPTVGLHPRDTGRLIESMMDLKRRGNTLVVVEHEESVMRAADYIVDMGPGSGSDGGEKVFEGEPGLIEACSESITGDFLSGRRGIALPTKRRKPTQWIKVRGANRHNLVNLDVDIPLGVYACLTGVSGSGKSTLAHDVIYLNACLEKGMSIDEEPAVVKGIRGLNHVDEVVMVDQSPLIRTPRSTPAVYVGLFEEIRSLFAKTDVARARGLAPGFFSFNHGDGRCPRCAGMGSEKVEMQFLSDIFVPCPLCNGSRYGQEALSVLLNGKNIAGILAMSVRDAIDFFANQDGLSGMSGIAGMTGATGRRIATKLDLLMQVGLGHLVLGQPLNSLSGGENQRLKLAKILLNQEKGKSKAKDSALPQAKGKLLILDEPGTGLHFSDLEVLIRLFEKLVDAGHSLLVIEHNLELIKAADYLVDLGPEGGIGGGQVVATGTPEKVAQCDKGFTSRYLNDVFHGSGRGVLIPEIVEGVEGVDVVDCLNEEDEIPQGVIALRGARHHNLKNVDLDVVRGEMTVLTGLSGSGKSSLAFDIFFAEGQRRFMDVMSPYARQFTEQMESPNMDRLTGLPPTVAIEQNLSRGGSKSTVGTVTEIWQFLRLLYARLGQAYCPHCQVPVGKRSSGEVIEMVSRLIAQYGKVALMAPVVHNRKGHYADLVRWAQSKGYVALWIDGQWVNIDDFTPLDRYANHDVDLVTAQPDTELSPADLSTQVHEALELGEGFLHVYAEGMREPVLMGTKLACPSCGASFPAPEPSTFSFNSPRGWCPTCRGHGRVSSVQLKADDAISLLDAELRYDRDIERQGVDDERSQICPDCGGFRLNDFARHVRLQGMTPCELGRLSAIEAVKVVREWVFEGRDELIARDSVKEVIQRFNFLDRVGLGYLSLDRSATTLSGGETQRIRLAAQLGSHLRGILYVLDEPTIGLHPRDNERLLDTLDELKKRGNTLLVVEHDEETMARADHIVDLGPGAGIHGGEIVASGSLEEIIQMPESVTGRAFLQKSAHPYRGTRRTLPNPREAGAWLRVTGCCLHNLKKITAKIPVQRLTVLTGVSGAGKTTLMTDTIQKVAAHTLGAKLSKEERQAWDKSSGFEQFRAVYSVDQSPIGKTPRSTPATYVGFLDDIRRLFAQTEDARRLGFESGRFSFNTSPGNCESCKGRGLERLEMDFLPPCYVPCETCRGTRYNSGTLTVRYKGKTIADILEMNFEEAAAFFESQPRIADALQLLSDTGLGYLTLGQASNTLSGGEAQRLKLVTELIKGKRVQRQATLKGRELPHDLYLIEEPSIGLHPHDVRLLVDVLHRLVDQGHTVIVIEHNTEIMAEADYILDMGPGPGEEGGKIVASGTPEQIALKDSPTALYIKKELEGAK
ncbi:MAG: excinuclease ABC subunit UvrA [Akkermansia sp.]